MPEEDEDALTDAIEANAIGPKRVQGDNGNSVEQHSLAEQIAADKHVRNQRAAAAGIPIRTFKIVPPGTV